MIDISKIDLEKIEVDYSAKGNWNCDKCIFFDGKTCECNFQYRYMAACPKIR